MAKKSGSYVEFRIWGFTGGNVDYNLVGEALKGMQGIGLRV